MSEITCRGCPADREVMQRLVRGEEYMSMSMSMYASSAEYWKEQAEANEKDAERYRWVRNSKNGSALSAGVHISTCDEYPNFEEVDWCCGAELDSLIDNEMQASASVGAA
jgi:sarcosine oxidase delta subunit